MKIYTISNIKNPLILKKQLMEVESKIGFFDTNGILCENQIISALEKLSRIETNNNMKTKTWGLELLLLLTGKHQISEALKLLEITHLTRQVIVVGEKFPLNCEFTEGVPSELFDVSKLNLYNISKEQYCKSIINLSALLMIDNY